MSDVVGFGIVVLQFSGFEEHSSHPDRVRAMRTEMRFELVDRQSRVHYILHDNHIALVHHLLERHDELQLSGSSHTEIGADADERLFAPDILIQRPDEVRGKDKSAVEDHDKERFLIPVVRTNAICYLLHILRYLLRSEPFLKMITLFVDASHIYLEFEDLLLVVLEEKVVIGIALDMDRLDAVVHERAQ